MRLYDHVRVVAPGIPLRRREALAAAARSLDTETSVDTERKDLESELDSLPKPVPSRTDARRRLAETTSELDAKRERVATLRGRMQAAGTDRFGDEYRAAIGELSEAETEHVAAREALVEIRRRARTARNSRERRLRLEDRLGNLQRAARRERLNALEPRADTAVSKLPDGESDCFEAAKPVSAALALVRIGRLELPIVLASDRFETRDAAERWLDASVLRMYPEAPDGL